MEREQIDDLLHELLRHKMARHVQQETAPPESRVVFDRHRGHRPRGGFHLRLPQDRGREELAECLDAVERDRKSTRLNSSHTVISYAVFCLKKKKKRKNKKNNKHQ